MAYYEWHFMSRNLSVVSQPPVAWATPIKGECCVVTGCDSRHEWILEWWRRNYINSGNSMPVCFADFGMSKDMRDWCESIGDIIDLRFRCPGRNWFKKPFAMLGCPFTKVIWVDSDCEIRGNLEPLLGYTDDGVGVTLDQHNPWIKSDKPVASGVVVAQHGNKLILDWAKACMRRTKVRGDQEVLNQLIANDRNRIAVMPLEYQWLRLDGDNPEALIMHWTGAKGKAIIRNTMGLPKQVHRGRISTKRTRSLKAGSGRSARSVLSIKSKTRGRRAKPLKSKPKPMKISLKRPR